MLWRITAIGGIQFGHVFLVGLLLYVIMQSLIAWLNEYSWHQLSTIVQAWTTPVSVLGRSWSTSSLFYQFSLLSSFCYEQNFFISPSVQNAKRMGVNNFRMTLLWYPIAWNALIDRKKALSSLLHTTCSESEDPSVMQRRGASSQIILSCPASSLFQRLKHRHQMERLLIRFTGRQYSRYCRDSSIWYTRTSTGDSTLY